jgi:heat-inducible transcriptional repressor
MSRSGLADRGQQVLKSLVECYVSGGQPVGSKLLSERSSLALSAATIRNVMADLEVAGFIESPHTSAGRIPTARGYRFFVDSLITMQPIEDASVRHLEKALGADLRQDQLIDVASRMLAGISRQAGLVMLPCREDETLRQVEFLPLSSGGVLVVLVLNQREVQNRVIQPPRVLSEDELKAAANFINSHYAGRQLSDVRQLLVEEMQRDKDRLACLMQDAIDLAAQAFDDRDGKDYLLSGESHLIGSASTGDMQRLRQLFEAFEQKGDILDLLERCLNAEGTQVYIGEESGFQVLDEFSVVTTPYQVGGAKVGVLGVIGPTRMAYERVIPLVDITSRLLSAALEKR